MGSKYYQLTKPWHIYGNGITALAGFLFAAQGAIDFGLLLAMLIGVSLVVAAGCVFNNILERDLDGKMARTKKRALVSGEVSVRAASVYASILTVAGFALLIAYTNLLTAAVVFAGLFFYVVVYGFFKPRTVRGTEVGSISGGMPIVAGYTSVTGSLDAAALLLFLVLVTYQMPHFYAIAIYRAKEYAAAKIPVLPLEKGVPVTKKYIVAYVAGFIVVTALLTALGYTGYTYLAVMLLVGAVWLWRSLQGFSTKRDEPWARRMLKTAVLAVVAFSFMISIDTYLP